MRSGNTLLFTITAFFHPILSVHAEQPAGDFDVATELNRQIPGLLEKYEVPGLVIAVLQADRPVYQKAFGYADLKTKRKFTVDTYCRMESISKSVTAWGVMTLVSKGLVDLDQPVQKYLKEFKFPQSDFPEDRITVRQLLNQTSGMPLGVIGVRYGPAEPKPSLKESLAENAVAFANPGESFSYSNVNYHLLELLIEEVTGESFENYMQREVLIPARMTRATFEYSPEFEPPLATGYTVDGSEIPPYVYPEKGAGGLFATLPDIVSFLQTQSHVADSVLPLPLKEQMHSKQVEVPGLYGQAFPYYGFGHFIEELPNGKLAVSHGGQGSGWMTHFHLIPETGDGIVILTNSQRSWPLFAEILTIWAKSVGAESSGMTKVLHAQSAAWFFFWLIVAGAVWNVLQIFRRDRIETRPRMLTALMMFSGLMIACLLVWASLQDYLFLESLLPRVYSHLIFALWVFTGVLVGRAVHRSFSSFVNFSVKKVHL